MKVSKKSTVSAIAVVDLADELISRNMIDQATLKLISVNLEKRYREHHAGESIIEKRLPETDILSLWEIAKSVKLTPSLGIDIGQSVNVNAKGLLANWLSCCDTLKQALNIFHDNIALLNESESWSFKEEFQNIKLSFKFSSNYTYPVMAIDRSMVALIAWAEHFTSSKLNVQRANFKFDKPAYSHRYAAIFGSNIYFNAGENSIELLHSELDKTIQSSNPYLEKLIAERSENIPFQVTTEVSTQAKVESLLKTDVMTGWPYSQSCKKCIHIIQMNNHQKLLALKMSVLFISF